MPFKFSSNRLRLAPRCQFATKVHISHFAPGGLRQAVLQQRDTECILCACVNGADKGEDRAGETLRQSTSFTFHFKVTLLPALPTTEANCHFFTTAGTLPGVIIFTSLWVDSFFLATIGNVSGFANNWFVFSHLRLKHWTGFSLLPWLLILLRGFTIKRNLCGNVNDEV